MTCAEGGQSARRSGSPSLAEVAGEGRLRPTEVTNVSWMWLNIPLMVLVVLAVAGIPLWLVLTRPDFSGQPDTGSLQPEMDAKRLVDLRQQGRREPADRRADALDRDGSDLLGLRLGVPVEAGHAAR
jgi:hypothetical protein